MRASILAAYALITTVLWVLRVWVLHALDVALAYARGQRSERKRNIYLQGKYKPVKDEVTCTDLEVEGKMPTAMFGVYARNGPNPRFEPVGNYHWFDGDGMTHAVRISSKGVSYSNRYVRTRRLAQEEKAGFPLFLKIGDACGAGYLVCMALAWLKKKTGVIDVSEGGGHANTALVFHAKQLLALEEGDMPYALRMLCSGVVETLGRQNFSGQLNHEFTAHPKTDSKSGELFAFGYNLSKRPFCTVTTLDAKGNLIHDVPITLRGPVMMHDCAITENYFIILDLPLFLKPDRMVKMGTLPFHFDKSQPARFGLLPRYSDSEAGIRWFQLPALMIFHTANAWQEGPNVVKLAACCYDEFDLDFGNDGQSEEEAPRLYMITLDLESGQASRRCISPAMGEFPTIHPRLTGRKTRYTYMPHLGPFVSGEHPTFAGISKVDLLAEDEGSALAGQIPFPQGFEGGEAYFVPTDKLANEHSAVEDAGYLVTFLTSASGVDSRMVVYDARTMAPRPVASVRLPARVPAGFHGLHINEEQLASQLP
mmetsp:Transcript_13987/g.42222  ORF Transcript_13987/g.42222 Transcript_13987/m.42222 type:complete len:538 (+) Transcript_13987:324-1937(+)|eukprot:CAMPEP_0206143828 /NCGR_PEP_ID=MMETSP1473-20131121/21977_1 /ASSEMBLY_ACC=CAM_ASM_001109 /TAXON_ID=1461547 /ORGANISM="Stichococcus sp, Strain RCC1054" /LENGTH=537 /DNA_ID=CAMNT_0053539409 /DNA_START=287 /DNA_END=1900 /DNA_ORIENTATION=-